MATTLASNTFSGTYKDDFLDSDNYHRILFNSGKALQARELTQSQTIIQKEIERFGSNIFREGGAVNGGNLTVNNKVEFIKLTTGQLPGTISDIIGKEFTVKSPNPAIKVKILEALHSSGTDPETLIVEYIDTSAGTSGSNAIRIGNSQTLENTTLGSSYDMITASSGATGVGTKASITAGSFFVQGHFVYTANQNVFLSKYSSTPTEDIGFLVTEEVVSADDFSALYDNQGASPNVAAPGADRYKITLSLTTRTAAGSDNFIYLGRIASGKIADEVTLDTSYNAITNLLATRTKEESGNYVAKPFNISFTNVDSANLKLHVTDGIAYVDGYRLELDEKDITIPKATTTTTINSEAASASYGNYVLGYGSDVSVGTGEANRGIPNIQTFAKFNLRSAVNHGGSTIGSARCRAIYRDATGHLRFYLFDIRMLSGNSFSSVKSFGNSGSDYVNTVLEGGVSVLKGTANNTLLFPLPRTRPAFDGVAGVQLITQKHLQVTTGGGESSKTSQGAGAITTGVNSFYGGTNWVVSKTNDSSIAATISNVGATFDISGLDASTTYDVLSQVLISGSTNMSQRTKTLTEATITKSWNPSAAASAADSDGSGYKFFSLDKPDIYAIKSVKLVDSAGADISSNFTLDNGQRDNFYGIGRLLPKAGVTIPTSNIFVRFQYFEHEDTLSGSLSGQRCYFDATSYKNQETPANGGAGVLHTGVTYDTIYDHTMANGSKVNLRDYLDFRPVSTKKNSSFNGTWDFDLTFDSDGAGSNPLIHMLPQPGGNPTANVTYYLPRKDRLVASTKDVRGKRIPTGEIRYIQGTPSIDPELPPVPSGAMPLYNINLNPKTIDARDLSTTMVNNKRFTMADIAGLEKRIDRIEELTTLSLLELNTSSLAVIDSSGNARTKAGFLVDNFVDYTFTDIEGGEQRAVINSTDGLIGPRNFPRSTRLLYDSASGSTTTTRNADTIYLPINNDAVSFIKQDLGTTTENINPFAVITSRGHIDLSPSTDTWVETSYQPDNIVAGGTEIVNTSREVLTDNLEVWRSAWIGWPANDTVLMRGRVTTRRDFVSDRVLDVEILPFMRSIKVYFRAQGLRRKTKHFPYFGSTDISNFTRQETFQRWADRSDDAGNIYISNTAHPAGATDLTSDSTGTIAGSFIIPSTSTIKFNTGAQTFKLLDISGGIDSDAISTASATFTSTGILETRQRTFQEVRIEERITGRERRDPLAQSFWVSDIENPNGVYITKINVFFATKEDNFGVPVQLQLRRIEHGVPTDRPISGAVKFLNPADISSVTAKTASTTIGNVRSAPTAFTFDEPVYLTPGQEYAVVLLAESTEYSVYVAETYEFLLGSSSERINKQASLGSLFLSQNGSTWTPEQTKDLMFEIFRADFNTSATAVLKNSTVPNKLLPLNPFSTTAGDSDVRVDHTGHGFSKGDAVTISGVDTAIATVPASHYNGSHTITAVDHSGYTFKTDSAPASTMFGGGSAVIATQNSIVDTFVPQVQAMVAPNTSLSAQIQMANGLSYAGSTARSAASGAGSSYSAGTYADCQLNEINYNVSPKVILTDSNQSTASITPSANLKLTLSTTDTKVSPVIDLQRVSLLGFENIIDNQAAGAASGVNVPISHVAETDNQDGTHAAKHVTKSVVLEESAVGLKILFAANRPTEAEFEVYYRIGTADDNLSTISWVAVGQEGSNPGDNDKTTYREYEYLAGGQAGALDAFTKFQVKIVMTSTNSSKIPAIKDLRIIALVT